MKIFQKLINFFKKKTISSKEDSTEEFYAIIKLISGEEIFSLISIDEIDYEEQIILAQNPIVIKNFETPQGIFMKVHSWIEMSWEEIFVINMRNIITLTECKDERLINTYNNYLNETPYGVETEILNKNSGQVKVSESMGYLANVDDARKMLESLYKLKDNKEI